MPPKLKPRKKDAYVPAFTGLRALAAALVFAHHHSQLYWETGGLYEYFQEGYVGVTLFFTLLYEAVEKPLHRLVLSRLGKTRE